MRQDAPEELGLHAVILATSLNDLEATIVAETFAYMASEVETLGRPFVAPVC